jgi:hypothetical protein
LAASLPAAGYGGEGTPVEAAPPAPEPQAVEVPAFEVRAADVSQTLSRSLVVQTRVSVASKLWRVGPERCLLKPPEAAGRTRRYAPAAF